MSEDIQNSMVSRLWPYILGGMALGLDAYVIAGLLPSIAQDLGSSPGTIGLGVAAFTAAYAFSGPFLAGMAGKRAAKSLLIMLLIFVVANIASALSQNVGMFIATRLVAGAAAGIYSPLSSAVAANSVPHYRKGSALSLVLSGLAIGTVFGVPSGLLIAEKTSWRMTFVFIALIGFIATLGVAFKGQGRIKDVDAPSFTARLNTLRRLPNVLTMLVTLFTGIASLGLYTYFIPLLKGIDAAQDKTLLMWVWGIGGATGALFVGKLIDSLGKPKIVTAVITLSIALVFIILGANISYALLFVTVFLWGLLGWSSLAPQQHTLMTANPSDGATAVAANASANYLGSAIGSGIGSLLVSMQISGSMLAYLAAIPAIIAFVIQIFRIKQDNIFCKKIKYNDLEHLG